MPVVHQTELLHNDSPSFGSKTGLQIFTSVADEFDLAIISEILNPERC